MLLFPREAEIRRESASMNACVHGASEGATATRIPMRNRSMSRMSFELLKTDGIARRGRLTFPRGTVETPAFMPVGTYGSVKGMLPEQIKRTRRRDHPRQHLPPVPAPGPGSHRGARRPARVRALGQAHPHRFGRLPGVLAGPPAQDHRAGRDLHFADGRQQGLPRPRGKHAHPEGAGFGHRDDLRRVPAGECRRQAGGPARDRAFHGAVAALGRALASARTRATMRRCSASSRAACTTTCARVRRMA